MKKSKFIIPLLAAVIAVSVAWTSHAVQPLSDLVWFQVDANGNAIDPNQGMRGDQSPFNCPGGGTSCARALSISEGEVSLNSGSSTLYHINSGVDIQADFNDEETKP